MPALSFVPALTDDYTLWLIANQRHEWLDPVLQAARADRYLGHVFVSSRTGVVQPQPGAYLNLRRHANGCRPLFVTGRNTHASAAKTVGLDTLVADPAGEWIRTVQTRNGSTATAAGLTRLER